MCISCMESFPVQSGDFLIVTHACVYHILGNIVNNTFININIFDGKKFIFYRITNAADPQLQKHDLLRTKRLVKPVLVIIVLVIQSTECAVNNDLFSFHST